MLKHLLLQNGVSKDRILAVFRPKVDALEFKKKKEREPFRTLLNKISRRQEMVTMFFSFVRSFVLSFFL